MFGWGIYDFLGGVFSKQIGSFKSLFWSQWRCLLPLPSKQNFTFHPAIISPIAAIVYSAGYLFFFKGFEKCNVSIIAATMNLWAVFTMLFAFIFMGQRLSQPKPSAWSDPRVGHCMRNFSSHWASKRRFWGVSSSACFGISARSFLKKSAGYSPPACKTWSADLLLVDKQEFGLTNTPAKTKYVIALMGMIEVAAVALVNYGLTIGDAILITPIAYGSM